MCKGVSELIKKKISKKIDEHKEAGSVLGAFFVDVSFDTQQQIACFKMALFNRAVQGTVSAESTLNEERWCRSRGGHSH
jgi:hypothetical protein